MNSVFLTTAYRYGSFDDHCYLVGVYGDEVRALNAAIAEEEYRGGKYSCRVVEQELNGPELRVVKEVASDMFG